MFLRKYSVLFFLPFLLIACDMSKTKLAQYFNKTYNVLGEEIELCCSDPVTGFYRNGFCATGPDDFGTHIVCARVTDEFLQFSKSRSNDLTRAIPLRNFPGLKDGDKWCLCILRWMEALEAGVAPPIYLKGTHKMALDYLDLETLTRYALDSD